MVLKEEGARLNLRKLCMNKTLLLVKTVRKQKSPTQPAGTSKAEGTSNVKEEVVTIIKKSSEETVVNMEKLHKEALAAKEEEMCARINKAVEQCREEFAQLGKEQD